MRVVVEEYAVGGGLPPESPTERERVRWSQRPVANMTGWGVRGGVHNPDCRALLVLLGKEKGNASNER